MNLNEANAFCGDWLPAWTGNTPDRLFAFYDEGAFYSDPTVKHGLRGRAQILPYFTKLLKNNPAWKWNREEIFPSEEGFILKWKAVIPVRDLDIIEYGMDIVEVRNGKIIRNEVYFDTLHLVNTILKWKQA